MNLAVTLLLFHVDGRVLAISRGDNLKDWGLIGGKVEGLESLEQAIKREACEEAHIEWNSYLGLTAVFTSIARTRLTTTFLARIDPVPIRFPRTREGAVEWKHPQELCTSFCTYHDYNLRLFAHLGIAKANWKLP